MAKKNQGIVSGVSIFVILFIGASYLAITYYNKIFNAAVKLDQEERYVYVQSAWDRSQLIDYLYQEGILLDTSSFIWTADKKSFFNPKAGRYLLKDGMSNNELINLLRSGMQNP